LTKSYGQAGTKIIGAVAIFGIVLVFGVAVAFKATETPIDRIEFVWVRFEPEVNMTSMLATAYIYSDNLTLLEQFLLLNQTSWQSSNFEYRQGLDILIFIDFWDMENSVSNVAYRIGRSPILIDLGVMIITVVSDWSEPVF